MHKVEATEILKKQPSQIHQKKKNEKKKKSQQETKKKKKEKKKKNPQPQETKNLTRQNCMFNSRFYIPVVIIFSYIRPLAGNHDQFFCNWPLVCKNWYHEVKKWKGTDIPCKKVPWETNFWMHWIGNKMSHDPPIYYWGLTDVMAVNKDRKSLLQLSCFDN